jgi:hypothetical protein
MDLISENQPIRPNCVSIHKNEDFGQVAAGLILYHPLTLAPFLKDFASHALSWYKERLLILYYPVDYEAAKIISHHDQRNFQNV